MLLAMDCDVEHLQRTKQDLPSAWRVQPRLGCSVCRARHIKCEESKTGSFSCRTCLKAGRTCPGINGENLFVANLSPPPRISRSELEEFTFDKFANRFAPWLGKYTDASFWMKSVLPAAQGNDSVFSAALAVTALLELPMKEASPISVGLQANYQTAISWYRKSINASIGTVAGKESVPDISVLLLTTVIYINIEMRQGHYHNLHGLVRTAFALAYSARATLWRSKDTIVLASLIQVLEASIALAIDSICIPRSHRDFVIVLVLRIAAETGASEIDQLRFELFSLIFDVSDKCIGAEHCQKETCCIVFSLGPCPALTSGGTIPKEEDDVPFHREIISLEDRMREWYKKIIKYKSTLDGSFDASHALWRQQTMFFQARAQWQAHVLNRREAMDKVALEERFSALFELFEELAENDPPSWITDMAIVPPCFVMVWYLRDDAVLERVIKMFKLYKIHDKNEFMKNVLGYFQILADTDYADATELEQELFGHTPTILKKWHVFMSMQYLVKKKTPET